jgi:hypothetical protein
MHSSDPVRKNINAKDQKKGGAYLIPAHSVLANYDAILYHFATLARNVSLLRSRHRRFGG